MLWGTGRRLSPASTRRRDERLSSGGLVFGEAGDKVGHSVNKDSDEERRYQCVDVVDVGKEKVGGGQCAELVEGAEVR